MAELLVRWLRSAGGWLRRLGPRRVPVLRQTSWADCGAACVAMVLGYHGRRTGVSEVARLLGAGGAGATAAGLARVARAFGLIARGYSIEPQHLRELPLPAIIHWQFNHFMVAERWHRRGVEVVDPGGGRRTLSHDEVRTGLTGVVLVFERGPDFAARRSAGSRSWRRYLASVFGRPGVARVLVQVAAASLLLQVFGLAVPLATKVLVDHVLTVGLESLMAVLAVGMGVWVAALAVTSFLRSALLIYLQGRLDTQLMVGFLDHLFGLPYSFFQTRAVGDLAMRLSSNSMIREMLTSQTVSLLLDTAFAIVYLVLLFVLSPPFATLVLALAALQLGLIVFTTRAMHQLMQRDLAAEAEQQSYLVEAIKGIATVKASGAEERTLEHWSNLFFKHLKIALRRGWFGALVETATTALRTLAPLALLWFGTRQVLDGALSLGSMLALVALAGSFLAPLASLVTTARQLQTAGARLERITEVLDAGSEQDPATVRPAESLSGAIEVQGVSFRYRKDGPLVLSDVSFRVEPGQKVAFVGRSGSGKSTLAALLLGFYRPLEGRILYDGADLASLDYRSVRRQIGTVLQESYLFGGSIRSNIAFNDPALSFERVVEAARFAAIDRDVEALPMGYETLLPEGGGALSGGERQRLSIARAVAPEPAVLVFDEATSHLDSATEAQVEENLAALAATRVVIAHRLSTVRDADLILVLDEGVVVERGDHTRLMARDGLYASMVRRQQLRTPESSRAIRPRSPTGSSAFGLTAADRT